MTSLSTAQKRERVSHQQDVQRQVQNDIRLLNYISTDVNQMMDGNWNFGTLEEEFLKRNRTIDIARDD